MCDADDEKEIGGMDPSDKGESSEEDPEMEEEYPEEADAEEDFQRYVEELGRAPEPSPLRSSQASAPEVPVEAADRQSASCDSPSYNAQSTVSKIGVLQEGSSLKLLVGRDTQGAFGV
ncbi:hypothetical protein PIB30_012250 [Stylosanthes scabra]|uniref:Uncharacterized protein n=1 Tax=Stylosanthes scabra TaxID=79078 RepID=A0ABU6W426_9FABA|nr:hypothetical protein [Stylosanthes scabra]